MAITRPQPPTPPRLTGDAAIDLAIVREWLWSFYQYVAQDNEFQALAATFDPDALADPTDTNIATAQDTANQAFTLATAAQADAVTAQGNIDSLTPRVTAVEDNLVITNGNVTTASNAAAAAQGTANTALAKAPLLLTQFTLSNTDNVASVSFSTLPSYKAVVTATSYSGSPAVSAFVVVSTVKGATGCTVTTFAAPGLGNSITFDLILIPT